MIRIALVDDQTIVRTGVARILSPDDGFELVAECANGQEALERLPALAPEVVLMDIRMPVMDGITATRRLRETLDGVAILVLTTFGEDEVLWGALEAGAAGFVLKDASAEDLIAAVRAVAGGAAWLDPGWLRGSSSTTAGRWRPRGARPPGSSYSPSASAMSCG